MLESGIQRVIINNLEKEGFYVVKLITTTKNGIPDTLAFKKVKRKTNCFMVEVKQPGEESSSLQKFRHNEMNMFGMQTFVADSWDNLKQQLLLKNLL